MSAYICNTCGVQQADGVDLPDRCAICEDERQCLGFDGQRWTTLDARRGHFRNVLTELEPGLVRITTEPEFAIGQYAFSWPRSRELTLGLRQLP